MALSALQQRILDYLTLHPADDLYRWGWYLRHARIEAIAEALNEHPDDIWYGTKHLRMLGHIDGEGRVIRDPKPVASGFFDVRDLMRGIANPINLDTTA